MRKLNAPSFPFVTEFAESGNAHPAIPALYIYLDTACCKHYFDCLDYDSLLQRRFYNVCMQEYDAGRGEHPSQPVAGNAVCLEWFLRERRMAHHSA